ncbi:hypothetical protein A3C26_00325 [Candidatus Daviesbacteria bacterium RIFCSPHIGHO2_02_FULL_39_12]|uniref:RNA polymerase sigma-70 region 2 domain-containing protein n=2 Tax=Candidatus Daviesiibacteriota TaxID=1752718 RepID=A0A1F5J8M3_9BACT|nr:MAG: hypothetical protein A3C26_00325 [Candidatus Daviesbacteria bacterium RIFCSPHIGHO2_02_FULL_39_12]OGE72294.1 MAG: hypothetical protein A3H40_02255 [Candidatus Daviesbacteria bacterium RIFCSPLOWO2_02_FULL_38_15]
MVEQARSKQVGGMFEYHKDFIETAARWFTGNPQDAADVMQNAAEALLRGQPFEGRSSERTFLYEVVRNAAGMFYRANSAAKRGGGRLQSLESLFSEKLGTSSSAETIAILSETIREAGEEPCMALKLAGYTAPEIAAMTGVEVPAVKSRIHRWREDHK